MVTDGQERHDDVRDEVLAEIRRLFAVFFVPPLDAAGTLSLNDLDESRRRARADLEERERDWASMRREALPPDVYEQMDRRMAIRRVEVARLEEECARLRANLIAKILDRSGVTAQQLASSRPDG